MDWLLRIALFVIPLYIANGSAVVFAGKTPLDFGRNFFDGKPVLGAGKTIKGLVLSFALAVAASLILFFSIPSITGMLSSNYFFFGMMAAAGAHAGDLVASFFKRRIGFERGKSFPLLDQLDFIAGGVIFTSSIYLPSLTELIVIVLMTLILHKGTNIIAFLLKLKKVPW